jgi:iron complex transport system permease protein
VRARSLLLFGLCCAGLIAVAPWAGPALEGDSARFILTSLRLPRVALAALAGGSLAAAGAAFQILLQNPLASPSTIGTTAGAALGALALLVVAPAAASPTGLVVAAFAGAAAVSAAITAAAASRRLRAGDLILAGVALTVAAGAVATGLQLRADAAATVAAVRWSLGSVATVGIAKPAALAPIAAVAIAWLTLRGRALQTVAAGPERAASQGVDLVRLRVEVLTAGSLAVAGAVAFAGPIAFVCLIVPHLVRLALHPPVRWLAPLSALGGAAFLVAADAAARLMLPDRELPVGVVTAALGAPALILLLWRNRSRQPH